MKKVTIIILLLAGILDSAPRSRHVAEEWNTSARFLSTNMLSSGIGWYASPWLSVYYQTEDWWIYHCTKGWLYPESDGNKGVWLYWEQTGDWVWTREDTYPIAYNVSLNQWFNFCVSNEKDTIAAH